ncbi:MAG: carboxypeptidase regulatory-like domain-containing protein [Patescibacteria group bacterium]|nr:carboxypeptidase regulatory-like domain-containing protein [Patescibacteria group bacterium]
MEKAKWKKWNKPLIFSFSFFSGFTLVEVIIGIAVFLLVATAGYSSFVALLRMANVSQANILAVELADEQFEIIRNMPYVSVGLTNGIPNGVLPQTQTLVRGGFTFTVTLVIRNENLSTSTIQASSKLVEVDVNCASCQGSFTPVSLTGQVSPANLQSAASGGAIIVNVFDANGNPVQGATVTIQSDATSSVQDTDTTNNNGVLNVIGVPPGNTVYHITATKNGYSTDWTSPDATVVQGNVTTVSLSIDKLSAFTISSVSPTCNTIPNVLFNLSGSKKIGGALKYSKNLSTGNSGNLVLNNMEWDTYSLNPNDTNHDTNGITPFSPIALSPGNNQNIQLVVVPASENSLLVAVLDGSTKLPLSGATVQLSGGAYNQTQMTGQGYFEQTNWIDGATQNGLFVDQNAYASGSGVDTSTSSGAVVLQNDGIDPYNTLATGTLLSSIFDTGTTSNFYSLNWLPANEPPLSGPNPIAFQFATAASSTGPWTYLGPDGTTNSYYTALGSQINAPGNEFARYLLYMTTQTATVTPVINDVSFTYTSGCIPPGQVLFQNIPAGTYTLTISLNGYTTYTSTITINTGWQSQTIPLSPN